MPATKRIGSAERALVPVLLRITHRLKSGLLVSSPNLFPGRIEDVVNISRAGSVPYFVFNVGKLPRFNSAMPPPNFSWFIEDKLAALGLPSARSDMEFLCSIGVKQLISLTEKAPCLYGQKLTQVHIPIADMSPPSIEQVNEFLSVTELANLKGEVIISAIFVNFFR